MFPGDEVDDQVSVQGPLHFSHVLFDLDGSEGEKQGGGGEAERDKEVFHLKNECMLQTQEGPQRTTEWVETTKSPIISLVNRSVHLPLLSPPTLLFSSSLPLLISLSLCH